MSNKWDKPRYGILEVAQKLNCTQVDIIRFGSLNKLRIAAYINIERNDIRTCYVNDYPYEYSSGIYYVHYNKLMSLEFVDVINDIDSTDVLTINAYIDDKNLFYALDLKFGINKSKYKNIYDEVEDIALNTPQECLEYYENIYDEGSDEDNLGIRPDKQFDSPDVKLPYPTETGINYTVYRKDLVILHDDLMQFLENEPSLQVDCGNLLISETLNDQNNITSNAINAERKTYLLIITSLSKIIRGEYPNIGKHPILKGSKSESSLIEELADWKYYGLGKRNLQKIFSEAKKLKEPEVTENTLLRTIGAMFEMVLGTYHKGEKHPSFSSDSNLIIMLPTLEPSLSEVDSQSIFAKATEILRNS